MKYLAVNEISKKWNVSERSVRDYCNKGRVFGAYLEGKTWMIPENATKPNRQPRHSVKSDNLLIVLKREKESRLRGGIYHKFQVEMTYNSNHIEGSKLTYDETRYIFETNTISITGGSVRVDDVIETINHFRCIDLVIDNANKKLTESFIKQLHRLLKTNTQDANKSWFMVGDYKLLENEVGGQSTTHPDDVKRDMKRLLENYHNKEKHTIEDIIEFHVNFEKIHPFQDGNGRVGRLIAFKECLKNNIVPFIIKDDKKAYYYRGLSNWRREHGWLIDTCLDGQDTVKKWLDDFKIKY